VQADAGIPAGWLKGARWESRAPAHGTHQPVGGILRLWEGAAMEDGRTKAGQVFAAEKTFHRSGSRRRFVFLRETEPLHRDPRAHDRVMRHLWPGPAGTGRRAHPGCAGRMRTEKRQTQPPGLDGDGLHLISQAMVCPRSFPCNPVSPTGVLPDAGARII
jgi:hypothetical protein